MSDRYKPLLAAFLLTLVLFLGWRLQSQRQALKAERKATWMQYLRGPLSDLLYGSSRLRPLIAKPKLSPAEQDEAKDAVEHLLQSYKQAQGAAVLVERDPILKPMASAAPWHQQIYELLQTWKTLHGKPLGKEALETETDLRQQLWKLLNAQRNAMLGQGGFSMDEILEMNALLYSLQEEE